MSAGEIDAFIVFCIYVSNLFGVLKKIHVSPVKADKVCILTPHGENTLKIFGQ